MTSSNTQVLFFQHLKMQMLPHLSMVDEVAQLLEISNDSAYRRIRGDKPIELEEIRKLCSHYRISMDHVLNLTSDAFIFNGSLNDGSDSVFEDWLRNSLNQFKIINSFDKKHLFYLMKDIPPFVHFNVPELATFKCFFWLKSILHDESLKGVKFSFGDPRYEKFRDTSKKVIELYNQVPTTEIWNIESINSTLRQINFYAQTGLFNDEADIVLLYDKVKLLIDHIERQAEFGQKFNIGESPGPNAAEYRMFVNELILGDNTCLVELDNTRITFLNHSILYFISTKDTRFNNSMFEVIENLIRKSTLISKIGEKERSQFFNRLRKKIQNSRVSVNM
jgi:hypothetical protein